ncbi:Malate/lactate dehydrogenase [Peptoclostridium litorale DSM 5388]|uniref:L-lactate dehydrogenase n=1 Tax=Peptoclostridium litorale DSM 5388 TaxID=1121324 RepID=A0A069RE96_PEPLI|nr:lactate dehydrogenase [Peptoclostridium litorale]KDR93972.1 L-lactate dehydrogenase [Peptoclostridium litorale DSM 5388]KDR95399.1 L-lactate dehydrogenase [Peptoclostridium litorale DSM 5388]SIN89586.1 Malate/lactate dehydrogenase [Peptoclostridium litorale DSM 5388]
MNFYDVEGNIVATPLEIEGVPKIKADEDLINSQDMIYYAGRMEKGSSRRSFCISDPSLMDIKSEGIELLKSHRGGGYEGLFETFINERRLMYVNIDYPLWKQALGKRHPEKWRVNVTGLGDVGGTLLTGLRLLGGDCISQIGIYDRDEDRQQRWLMEAGQIYSPFDFHEYPDVRTISEGELFDCDMLVFCISVAVPPVGEEVEDVRMVQLKANSKIISQYGKMAREKGYRGMFAVVSDPVDPLCKALFISSNSNENGEIDYRGLSPEQISGYGLGVMNARALYYSKDDERTKDYRSQGRAYGPHGEGLVIANSIASYDDEASKMLTEKAKNANIEVRKSGYKPYIAPALSSGALSILSTIRGDWHYSSTFIGGAFMGVKNRLTQAGTELERLVMDERLFDRINETYERVKSIL